MRAESTNGKQRWTAEEKSRLKKLHSEAAEEQRSHLFFEKLRENFANRTVASVIEECRRLGLKPKRNPKSGACTYEGCTTELTKSNRIGDLCRRCYNRRWYRERMVQN